MGLGLHNDLQNEHSIVGNFPTTLAFRDFGTEAQKTAFIPGSIAGEVAVGWTKDKVYMAWGVRSAIQRDARAEQVECIVRPEIAACGIGEAGWRIRESLRDLREAVELSLVEGMIWFVRAGQMAHHPDFANLLADEETGVGATIAEKQGQVRMVLKSSAGGKGGGT